MENLWNQRSPVNVVKRLALARGYAIEGLEVRAAEKLNILRVVDAVHLLLLGRIGCEARL